MSRVTKGVSDRGSISRTVLSSLEVHGADVSADLTNLLFPDGVPKKLTVEAFIAAFGQALSRSVTQLTEADMAHAQELSDDDAPRVERDDSIAKLREKMINLRNMLSGAYGSIILAPYGLSGETPDDAELLVTRARNTESLLRSRAITETPKQEGVSINTTALAKGLASAVDRVDSALNDVRREEREAQLTLKRRNQALAAWNARYQGVADLMTGIYELVGRADLADLVRPTARRRAGLPEEEDTTPPAEDPSKTEPDK